MSAPGKPGEFELIEKYLRPLAGAESGAAGLSDDAAVLAIRPGRRLVVTTDTLVAGVHFFQFTPPHFIAAKAIRVNLSDLAAMGAEPAWYSLSLSLPAEGEVDYGHEWLDGFAQALGVEQALYGVTLIGGDTVSTPGPLSLTVTALGWVGTGRELRRSGAAAGDLLYVSGVIGDATLGLSAVRGDFPDMEPSSLEIVTERYHRPQPRLELGRRLTRLASSAIDVSDGLVQDLAHICEASGVGATVRAGDIPLSGPARALVANDAALIERLMTGGDDYELLFTIPPEWRRAIAGLAADLELPLTEIGVIVPRDGGDPVSVVDESGKKMALQSTGYRHF